MKASLTSRVMSDSAAAAAGCYNEMECCVPWAFKMLLRKTSISKLQNTSDLHLLTQLLEHLQR